MSFSFTYGQFGKDDKRGNSYDWSSYGKPEFITIGWEGIGKHGKFSLKKGNGKSKGKSNGKSKYRKSKGKGTWQRMSSGGKKGKGKSKASKPEKPAAELNELKHEESQMDKDRDWHQSEV